MRRCVASAGNASLFRSTAGGTGVDLRLQRHRNACATPARQWGNIVNAVLGASRRFDRRFYLGCSLVFVILVFWAFARTYFLKSLFGTPALTQLVHVHGIVMTGWVVLLLVQTCLVAAHRVRWHRRLGTLGAAWAILVVALGSATTIHAAAREVRGHSPAAAFQVSVLGLELLQMLLFAGLVTAAVGLRHRTDYHKRLMLLTAACMLPSVIPRLPFDIRGLWSIFCHLVLFVIAAGAIDTVHNRRLHPAFGWGAVLILVVMGVGVMASTATWWINLGTSWVS
jgi:hypothetical protein